MKPTQFIRNISYIAAACSIAFGMLHANTALAFSGTGAGTTDNPYIVTNCDELQSINNDSNTRLHVYILGNDIDCTETPAWNSGQGFEPINDLFDGTLDGRNHTITGLTINRPGDQYVGLFRNLNQDAVVLNLTFSSSTLVGGSEVGTLAGMSMAPLISDVHVINSALTSGGYAGGIIGYMIDWGDSHIIRRSSAISTIAPTYFGGGLVGNAELSYILQDSYASSTVHGNGGGLFGAEYSACAYRSITDSYAFGSVTGGDQAGGFAGNMSNQHCYDTLWLDSFASVNLSGSAAGGLLGAMSTGQVRINNTTFDSHKAGLTDYVGPNAGSTISINASSTPFDSTSPGFENYLLGNNTDGPLPNWDFASVWATSTGALPTLRTQPTITPSSAPFGTDISVEGNSAHVTWHDPATPGDFPVQYYELRVVDIDDPAQGLIWTNSTSVSSTDITDLHFGRNYRIDIWGITQYGRTSSISGTFETDAPAVYEISSCAQLQNLPIIGTRYDTYVLTDNIDCSENDPFTPINWGGDYFRGVFNGNGHTITNVNINQIDGYSVGLFTGAESGAEIENVSMTSSTILGFDQVGSFVGYAQYGFFIHNTTSTANVYGNNNSADGWDGYDIGGLVGDYYGEGMQELTMKDNYFGGIVRGKENVGGMLGTLDVEPYHYELANGAAYTSHSYIQNNRFGGSVQSFLNGDSYSGWDNFGGIIGHIYSYPEDEHTPVDITVSGNKALTGSEVFGPYSVGGIIGYVEFDNEYEGSRIGLDIGPRNESHAVVSGYESIGGLVGDYYGYTDGGMTTSISTTISQSLSTSDVTAFNGSGGGLVGYVDVEPYDLESDFHIQDSYFNGSVTGYGLYVGGLIGYYYIDGPDSVNSISNSYAAGHVVGPDSVGGLIGYSDSYVNLSNSFASNYVHATDGSDVGAIFGSASDNGDSFNFSHNLYDEGPNEGELLCGANSDYGSCGGIDTSPEGDPTHFFNASNTPYRVGDTAYWDFDTVWTAHADALPTLSFASVGDVTAPEISDIAASVGTTTSTISWTTDENADSKVVYSPDTSYGSYVTDSSANTSHTIGLEDLVACTQYHYEVVSADGSGNVATSSAETFMTTGCAGGAAPNTISDDTIDVTTTSTVDISDTGHTFAVTFPANVTATSSELAIQIKSLPSSDALATIGTPENQNSLGGVVFDVKALVNSITVLDSFDVPVTISYHYTDTDVTGMVEPTLWMYHYHNGAWSALDNCVLDVVANTITCTAPNFSTFGLFGQSPAQIAAKAQPASGSGSSGGGSGGGVGSPVIFFGCTDKTATNYAGSGVVSKPELCTYAKSSQIVVTTPTVPMQPSAAALKFTRTLRLSSKGADVKALQIFLNTHGFVIAKSGAGSPGKETTLFGAATAKALAKFQEANAAQLLKPYKLKKGTGIFGDATMKFVNAIQ